LKRFLIGAAVLVTGPLARAEIAVMESGKILYVDRFERIDDRVTLYVTGGGVVTVPAEIVRNVVANEIVAQTGEDPQRSRCSRSSTRTSLPPPRSTGSLPSWWPQ
jgi:hypothetical protein